jgi:hypothetical protein
VRIINKAAWDISMERVDKIVEQEEQNGFTAVKTGMSSPAVDILVLNGEKVIRVYEITNYRQTTYMPLNRANRYKNNLLGYPTAEKILVCSFEENLRYLPGGFKFFTMHGIRVQIIGHQDKGEGDGLDEVELGNRVFYHS